MAIRTHRGAHQEAITFLEHALAIARFDMRMADGTLCSCRSRRRRHPLEHSGCSYCRGKPSSWLRSPSPIRMAPMPGTFFRISGRARCPRCPPSSGSRRSRPWGRGPDIGALVIYPAASCPSSARPTSARRRACRPARRAALTSGAESGRPRPHYRPLDAGDMRPDDAVGAEIERLFGEQLAFSPPFGGMRTIGVTAGATEPDLAICPRLSRYCRQSRKARMS